MASPRDPHPKDASSTHSAVRPRTSWVGWLLRLLGLGLAGLVSVAILLTLAFAMAYPKLPDIDPYATYRPKLPLRIFSSDHVLLASFGEEKREFVPIKQIPQVMIHAVLAAEDANFFEHSGVDFKGMARAVLANVGRAKSQGGSTISMQVARNMYLSTEKTYIRKIYEVLVTLKLEYSLSKAQILEVYMNHIYLGQRAYGFGAASQTYFGKPLADLTIAEAAMLAGLPKAPSAYNPVRNPKRARERQLYIIGRMEANGFITAAQALKAKAEPLPLRRPKGSSEAHADYIAEMVRNAVSEQYGDEAYTRGLNVYTTINAAEQQSAYLALRKGLLHYENRHAYRGPEQTIALPQDPQAQANAIDDTLENTEDQGDLVAAVVVEASPQKVVVAIQNGETLTISGRGLQAVKSSLTDRVPQAQRITRGSLVRITPSKGDQWVITQTPEVEGALISMDPRTGQVRALVGGFDFAKNQFNHVTQAWRQPGSSFKPFIYSAAFEAGLMPSTVINDSPLFFTAEETGGQPWEPKNYDGRFEGPMSARRGLAKSKNMISIRVLQTVGPANAQEWALRFGFDRDKVPPYYTMALGAGSATPMQMATAYSVFANGGYHVAPALIQSIKDQRGATIFQAPPTPLLEEHRVISARNAFMMSNMLKEITRSGTAQRASRELARSDLFGKTGTTNDSQDAWFVGYQPSRVAAVWVGYDSPKNLGNHETGSGLALPIWIDYMAPTLASVPEASLVAPPGVVQSGGEWYYSEYTPDRGIASIGLDASASAGATETPAVDSTERKNILDLFRGN
jgi:penicillin-binding protein 1A